ncbi:hypothetical protein [Rheinheimera soli]|uniref:Lipoprotein n=1 Tax=Rheinheimera soli TaxID=443616 RepID=A0ABU1VY96_9GAMM|nr:hypothetical protein [Rheinheimera soli]MDR7120684.1 hypothetical protein [Rheinheimera soli]
MMIKFLPLLAAFLLSACVVISEEYFHPQAVGAEVEKESCRGKVGADNQLVYTFDNVRLMLRIKEYSGKTNLGIEFRVAESGTVAWPDQLVELYVDDLKTSFSVKSFRRLRAESGDLITKDYAVGTLMDNTSLEDYETFHESFIVQEKKSAVVKIEQIKVIVNGKLHVLKDILFTKKKGVFLHPLNC